MDLFRTLLELGTRPVAWIQNDRIANSGLAGAMQIVKCSVAA
jgi:hypothetical protein